MKINRRTAFGTSTLVLTDFSNKSTALEGKTSQHGTLDGEFQNSPPTTMCFREPLHPSKERANHITPPSNGVHVSLTVCSQSKVLSPANKKLKTTHSSPDLNSGSPGFSNRYDTSNLDLEGIYVKFLEGGKIMSCSGSSLILVR